MIVFIFCTLLSLKMARNTQDKRVFFCFKGEHPQTAAAPGQ